MPRVKLLDGPLIDQIAAGEVVERPASVVKELIDNALDAGAMNLMVELLEGGRERILVSDDGAGMNREDARLAVQRHATSKLRQLDDLASLRTFGFRGEALPSIASVSRFRMLTREHDAIEGTEVRIEGGEHPSIGAAGCAAGTTIDVQELFFNVPARRKFMRARNTELKHVARVCLHAALAHPRVRLVLSHNRKRLREYVPVASRERRAEQVFADLEPFTTRGERGGVAVLGVLSAPKYAARGSRNLHLFVNGRPIVDRQLAFAVAGGFGERLGRGQYPQGALFVELDPSEVDVNAHPQKTEVRFRSPRAVSESVSRVIARTLAGDERAGDERPAGAAAAPSLDRSRAFWGERLGQGPRIPGMRDARATYGVFDERSQSRAQTLGLGRSAPAAPTTNKPAPAELGPPLARAPAQVEPPSSGAEPRKPLGDPPRRDRALQRTESTRAAAPPAERVVPAAERSVPQGAPVDALDDGYLHVGTTSEGWWLIEDGGELVLVDPKRIDQKLAQEALESGASAPLLFPARRDLSQNELHAVERGADDLKTMGFDWTTIGARTVAVQAVPQAFASAPPAAAILAAARSRSALLELAPAQDAATRRRA
ncbi:MAG: DNA mismatch repair endonuclease MutL, partial [Myxococcota bacterium]